MPPVQEQLKRGDRLLGSGDLAQAELAFRLALTLAEAEGDIPATIRSLLKLGVIALNSGHSQEAEEWSSQAIELIGQSRSSAQSDLVVGFGLLGSAQLQHSKLAEAERNLTKAVEIGRRELGPRHQEVGALLSSLAHLYLLRNKPELALPLARRSHSILEESLSPDHPDTQVVRHTLASVYIALGECLLAERILRKMLISLTRSVGDQHPEVTRVRSSLIVALVCRNHMDEAEPMVEPTMRSLAASFGAEHPFLLPVLLSSARIHERKARSKEAVSALRLALQIWFKNGTDPSPAISGQLSSHCLAMLSKRRMSDATRPLRQDLESAFGADWYGKLREFSGSSYARPVDNFR